MLNYKLMLKFHTQITVKIAQPKICIIWTATGQQSNITHTVFSSLFCHLLFLKPLIIQKESQEILANDDANNEDQQNNNIKHNIAMFS